MLLKLDKHELDRAVRIASDGAVRIDTSFVATLVARCLDTDATPHIAVSVVDYAETPSGEPVPETRVAAGIYWIPDEEDAAEVGRWSLDGSAFSTQAEGLKDSPVSEDASLINRATRAIASSYENARVVEPSTVLTAVDDGELRVRVFAIRDARVSRPEDLLAADESAEHHAGRLGVATVLLIGGGKALVRKYGC